MGVPTTALGEVTARYARRSRWLKRIALVLAVVSVVPSLTALWVDGHVPALTPAASAPFSASALNEAYKHVDSRTGLIDMNLLVSRRAPLELYVEQLASTSPLNEPGLFPKPADKLAYWLNAWHALVLLQMVEAWPTARSASELSHYRRTWPIGGSRLTLFSIERRFLLEAGDARVWFALFTGARGSGQLDGAPIDGATLDAQLNDAAKRFMRKKENVSLSGTVVWLSPLMQRREEELLSMTPPERRHILQVVWAFLPETCERVGCDTRGDLDRACGPAFERCQVQYAPFDASLAARAQD